VLLFGYPSSGVALIALFALGVGFETYRVRHLASKDVVDLTQVLAQVTTVYRQAFAVNRNWDGPDLLASHLIDVKSTDYLGNCCLQVV
jgi:hypothetical protein